MKTELKDRTLWFDGESSFDKRTLANRYLSGDFNEFDQITHEFDEEIAGFLKINPAFKFKNDIDLDKIDPLTWNLEEFCMIDYKEKLAELCYLNIKQNRSDKQRRIARLETELQLVEKLQLESLIRAAFYIVDRLNSGGHVWGVGRGSACSSYILYLIGIHDIDPIKYNLDCSDFFRDK